MNKQSTNAQVNFLIRLISYKGVDFAARALTRAAGLAYAVRRLDEVEAGGFALMNSNLPSAWVGTGAYFAGLAGQRFGTGDLEKCKELLTIAVSLAPEPIRSRAILALGSVAEYQGDHQSESEYYHSALRYGSDDAFTFIETKRALAIMRATEGNHRAALGMLSDLQPYVLSANNLYLTTQFCNSLAVELNKVGKVDDAAKAASVAVGSPLASHYPEFFHTADDIAARRWQAIASHFQVSVPEMYVNTERMRLDVASYIDPKNDPDPIVISAMYREVLRAQLKENSL